MRIFALIAVTTALITVAILSFTFTDAGGSAAAQPTLTPTSTASQQTTPCPTVSPTSCDVVTNPPTIPTPTIPFCDTGHFPNATICPTVETAWGDNNCSSAVDPADALLNLRFDAGLSTSTGDCPSMGWPVEVLSGSPHTWGDVDCTNDAGPVDALKLLRFDAGLAAAQGVGCPLLGSEVWMAVLGPRTLELEVSLLADGDDEDNVFTKDEVVSPGSLVTYAVYVDNDSYVGAYIESITGDVYDASGCWNDFVIAPIIGEYLSQDDGDSASFNGVLDELGCYFKAAAPEASGSVVESTVTVTLQDPGAHRGSDSDSTQITVN